MEKMEVSSFESYYLSKNYEKYLSKAGAKEEIILTMHGNMLYLFILTGLK